MEYLNLILFTAESFKKRFDSVKKMMQVESYDVDAVSRYFGEMRAMLDDFIENLSQPTPELPREGFTLLDRLIRDQRNKEWGRIHDGFELLRIQLRDLTSVTSPEQLDPIMDNIEDYINQLKDMAYEV